MELKRCAATSRRDSNEVHHMSENDFENEPTAVVEPPPAEKPEKPARKPRKTKAAKEAEAAAAAAEEAVAASPVVELTPELEPAPEPEPVTAQVPTNGNGNGEAAVAEARPQNRRMETQAAETLDIRVL